MANNFNFIRLLLACLVVISHSYIFIDGNYIREPLFYLFGNYTLGQLAVNCFFILSGYLVTDSWESLPLMIPYLKKRLLRIVPGFLVAVAITIVIIGPLLDHQLWNYLPLTRFIQALLFLNFNIPQVYNGHTFPVLNGSLWTIHYEFICYLLLGAAGASGMLRQRHWIISLFALSVLVWLAAGIADAHHWSNIPMEYSAILRRGGNYIRFVPLYLTGVCWYIWRDHLRLTWKNFCVAVIFFVLLMLCKYGPQLAMTLPLAYVLYALGHSPIKTLSIFNRADLSYGCYLYAWPIQKLLLLYGIPHKPWLLTLATIVCVFPLASFSWFCIEKPMLRLKPRRSKLNIT